MRAPRADVAVGRPIIVDDVTRNGGRRAVPASVTRIYLVRTDAAQLVARRGTAALAPRAESRGRTAVSLPLGLAAGTYRVMACAGDGPPANASACHAAAAPLRVTPAVLPERRAPITAWRPTAGFEPLSDAAAAAHVRPVPEIRTANTAANVYVPSTEELASFRAARDIRGRTVAQRNPYLARVSGAFSGTTDEVIQWAAWKWGIPEDWLRAQYAAESRWRQSAQGDLEHVGTSELSRYPPQSRQTASGGGYTGRVWQSLGISQVKWTPDGSIGAGTEPLRWRSTAFAVDYQAATVRWYYDDPGGTRSSWGDASYRPGDGWLSIGGWFSSYPWGNPGQRTYVARVRRLLVERVWGRAGF